MEGVFERLEFCRFWNLTLLKKGIPLADGLTVAVEDEFSELFPFTGAVKTLKIQFICNYVFLFICLK